MKLLGFELTKLLYKRMLWVILLGCLLGNAAFFYFEQVKSHSFIIQQRDQFKTLAQQYIKMPAEAVSPDLEHRINQLQQRMDQGYAASLEQPEMMEQLQQLSTELQLYLLLQEQYTHIADHTVFLEQLASKADDMLSVSIFQKQDSFSYRNIIATAQAFERQGTLTLQPGINEQVESFFKHRLQDYIIVFFMLVFGFFIFHQERESKMDLLIRSTKHGRRQTILSKLMVYFVAISFVFFFVFGSSFAMTSYLYGMDFIERSIQSVPGLARGQYVLSIAQFFIIFILLKWLAFLMLAALSALLFVAIRHLGQLLLIAASIIAIQYASYIFIHPYSPAGILKFVNLFYVLQTDQLLTYYRNLNLFGYPVPLLQTNLVFLLLAIIISVAASVWIYCKKLSETSANATWLAVFDKLKSKLLRPTSSYSLFVHEWYKNMISNKGIVFIICALFFGYIGLQQEPIALDHIERTYLEYMGKFSGPLTEQRIEQIEQEKERLQGISNEIRHLEQALLEKKIELSDYSSQMTLLMPQANASSGFYKLYDQMRSLLMLQQSTGQQQTLMSATAGQYLFDHPFRVSLTAIIYMTLLMLSLSTIITSDYRSGMHLLQRSSRFGQTKLLRSKRAVSYIVICFLYIIVFLPPFLNVLNYYPHFYWNAPIQSIPLFEHYTWTVKVWQWSLLVVLLQLAASFVISEVIFMLSYLMKKQVLVLGCCIVLFLFPLITGAFYPHLFASYPVNRLLMLQLYNADPNGLLVQLALFIIIGLICAFASRLLLRPYTNWRRGASLGANDSSSF